MRLSRRSIHIAALVLSFVPASVAGASGCATESAHPTASTPAEAELATSIAFGFMGVGYRPDASFASRPPIERVRVARLRAVATEVVAIVEAREPGVLRRLSFDLGANDAATLLAAVRTLRARLSEAAGAPELRARLARDPLFRDNLRPTGGAGFEVRTMGAGGDDVPNLGRGPNGRYGDDREGAIAALGDAAEALGDGVDVASRTATRGARLVAIDAGALEPDPASRLGAYAATAGYPEGTVGNAVHRAIGTIYLALGTSGEERIGRVFNAPQARALYMYPVDSDAGARMAAIEQRYWQNVANEDPYSIGGQLGAAFSPAVRDWLQRNVFALGQSALEAGDGGADAGSDPPGVDTCVGKADGYYCSEVASYAAYQCEGGQIAGGVQCLGGACGAPGSRAKVDGNGQLACH